MKTNLMYQCQLKSGNATLITWLPDTKDFEVGNVITLKETGAMLWRVMTKGKGHPRSEVKDRWESQDLKRSADRQKINIK